MISSEVLVAVLSLLGTAFGSVTGIMAANRLTNYRIAELEKKVDKQTKIYWKYCNLLKEIATKRGIPFLDLFHCSGLRPWEESYRQIYYSKDNGGGVHPNELGHAVLASKFKGFLETLLL